MTLKFGVRQTPTDAGGCRVHRALIAVFLIAGCAGDGPNVTPKLVKVSARGCGLAPSEAVGFVVDPNTVMTVAHAVQGAEELTIDGRGARLVAIDRRADVALLRFAVAGPSVSFATAHVGSNVWVQLPDGAAMATVLRTPTIEHTVLADDVTHTRDGLVLDVALEPRQSGSPVVNERGQVVAMIYARSTESVDRAYAIAATELASVLATVVPSGVDPGEC